MTALLPCRSHGSQLRGSGTEHWACTDPRARACASMPSRLLSSDPVARWGRRKPPLSTSQLAAPAASQRPAPSPLKPAEPRWGSELGAGSAPALKPAEYRASPLPVAATRCCYLLWLKWESLQPCGWRLST